VKAAFDTIPQNALWSGFISTIPSKPEYRIARHVEIKPGVKVIMKETTRSKPIHKWTALAKPPDDYSKLRGEISNLSSQSERKNTIFVENIVNQISRKTDELLDLIGRAY
jgi:hypothetical protein